jgi:hypothetical protein
MALRIMPAAVQPNANEMSTERLATILNFLVTFAHIDGEFHQSEQEWIASHLEGLLNKIISTSVTPEMRAHMRARSEAQLEVVFTRVTQDMHQLAEEIPRDRTGAHLGWEQRKAFIYSRLKMRCVELLRGVSDGDRQHMLGLLDALIRADGKIDPAELKLREELLQLASMNPPAYGPPPAAPPQQQGAPSAVSSAPRRAIAIVPTHWNPPKAEDPPVLRTLEQAFSPHPTELRSQLQREQQRIGGALVAWGRQRDVGNGRLAGHRRVTDFPEGSFFLDQFTYVLRPVPSRPLDLVVVGDLHGCYSCLKAVLLQSDFFRRAWMHQQDPTRNRDIKLVFLGDYIDRGRYSFDGVLRAVLQLFILMPDYVVVLRGNHEHYIKGSSGIYSAVYPAEALATLAPYAPPEILDAYRMLFEAMPTSMICERTLLVHGGIPREDTFSERWRDLNSLNDIDMRFQMMWSDPAQSDYIPLALQRENPRFSFGRNQFRQFMDAVGCTTMIRGHERVLPGFERTFELGEYSLLNVFSAGGITNNDLPPDSSYRQVTPMAVTIRYEGGFEVANPWPINYATYGYAPRNGLMRPGEFKIEQRFER